MGNHEKVLQELQKEWFASLPNIDNLPPFETSEKFKKWEQRVIYNNLADNESKTKNL